MSSIFISYSWKDKSFVRDLEDCLDKSDVKVGRDEREFGPGDWLIEKISKVIEEVDYVVAVISSNSVNSEWVQKEINLALTKEINTSKRVVLPIRLDDCEMPATLRGKVYADFRRPDDFERQCKNLLNVITENQGYLGRIARAKRIADELEDTIEECGRGRRQISIRMRATFTSMSDIRHYQGKTVVGLFPSQAKELDDQLVRERKAILRLLNRRSVSLQCICCPKAKFLSGDTYTDNQKRRRFSLLRTFLSGSLDKHLDRRRILCDKAGAYGNQLLIGNRVAIVANPESGGYEKTSVITDRQAVDVLIREYDILFERIWKSKRIPVGSSAQEYRKEALLQKALLCLERNVAKI